MQKGQLMAVATVGTLLLAGLVVMVGMDLTHRFTSSSALPPALPNCCPPPREPLLPFLALGEVPMEIQSLDRGYTIPLSVEQVQRLRLALALVEPVDIPSPSIMMERYPRLQIRAHTATGIQVLKLNNQKRLWDAQSPHLGWSMPPGFWDEVVSWLPPETSRPTELSYLLRATELIEPFPGGPVTHGAERAALIARLLLDGREIDLPRDGSTEERGFTLTFIVEGAEYRVHLRPNSFTVGRHTYALKDAALIVGANLHAN